jgi:putative lipoic acid-binding regulatory protein
VTDDRPIQTFPDTYSIKAVGEDKEDFAAFAVALVRRVIADDTGMSHYTRASRNGKYLSVTISFRAGDQAELDRVFAEMSAAHRVVWVL